MTKIKEPRFRFSEFSGEWKKEKLDNIAKVGDGLHGTPNYSDNGQFAFINGNNLRNSHIFIDNSNKYVKYTELENVDKAMGDNTLLISLNGTVGNISIYNNEKVMLSKSTGFINLNNSDRKFILYYLSTYNIQKSFIKNVTGTTIKNLSLRTLKNTTIGYTSKIEQQKIGDFFAKQDKLIELQTQKVEQLNKLKRGYLQKVFPQEGETVPRLRFSGFSGEWKEEKLGCISNISNGVTGDVNLHDGKYKITRIETISDGRVNENKLGYIGYNPGENKLLKKGDILYSNINSISHIGKTAIFESASKIYHGINLTRISVGSEFDSYFINYLLNAPKYKLWSIRHANQAVSQASINNKDLSKMQITAPTLSEQKEVATFLLSLDKLIEEQSNKLDQLKQQKKAYLQKMFI